MSLFDVIKYGNIDLSDKNVLKQLPEDLIEKYHEKLSGEYVTFSFPDLSKLARHSSYWPATSKHCFRETLKELP